LFELTTAQMHQLQALCVVTAVAITEMTFWRLHAHWQVEKQAKTAQKIVLIVMLRKNAPMRAQLCPQLVKSLKLLRQSVDVPRIAVNQLQNHTEMHYAVVQ
jgi:hypothetical protein